MREICKQLNYGLFVKFVNLSRKFTLPQRSIQRNGGCAAFILASHLLMTCSYSSRINLNAAMAAHGFVDISRATGRAVDAVATWSPTITISRAISVTLLTAAAIGASLIQIASRL
jgi:hypothetical protein